MFERLNHDQIIQSLKNIIFLILIWVFHRIWFLAFWLVLILVIGLDLELRFWFKIGFQKAFVVSHLLLF